MSCSGTSSRRILVVSAHENFGMTISRILCRCGYQIDVVPSGEEAMKALDEATYDLVLSEVLLPGDICGLTVACKAREHGRKTPFIFLSETVTERMKWIVSGMEGVHCLRQPVDVDQLKEVVATSLDAAGSSPS
jgi:DNA-binding response OmpR family regulator